MSVVALLLILVPLLLGVALVIAIAYGVVRLTSPRREGTEAAVRAARHRVALVHVCAWLAVPFLALLVVVLVGASLTALPATVALVPAVIGLGYVAVFAVGESTWRRPAGERRSASLTARSVATISPVTLRRLTWGWPLLALPGIVLGGVSAAPTGELRRLRTLPDGASTWSFGEPYPSWAVGLALLAALVAVTGASELVLRSIAARPAVPDVPSEWDADLRRLTAHRVLRGPVIVGGLTVAGLYACLGAAWTSVGMPAVGWSLVALAIVCAVVALSVTSHRADVTLGDPSGTSDAEDDRARR
ncbi:hypothetical protein [Oerskovia flava]|uniref:hypothetical protein n=1 Tax=Oerskovia flava TaxID=2986422 RepID=UPI002240AD7C|nr:hypothetical protein [Oerskovia sp. JB1-3-2]